MTDEYTGKNNASFDRTVTAYSALINDALSDSARLRGVFDRISAGAELSVGQIKELLSLYPELITSIKQTDSGFTLAAEDIVKLSEEICKKVKELISARKELAQTQLSSLEAQGADEKLLAERRADLEKYDDLLALLTIDISKAADSSQTLSERLKDAADRIKLIGKAASEQANGGLSASTYSALAKEGTQLSQCLDTTNGKLSLNIDKLKELEAQEYRNIISENRLAAARLSSEAATRAMSGEDISGVTKRINELKAEELLYESVISELYSAGEGSASAGGTAKKPEDAAKNGFEAFMREYEALHDKALISDKEYYEKLSQANEKFYRDSAQHLSDYQANVTKIYNGERALYKDETNAQVSALGKKLSTGEIGLSEYARELRALSQERYGSGSRYAGTIFSREQLDLLGEKAEESEAKAARTELEKRLSDIVSRFNEGLSDIAEYEAELKSLRESVISLSAGKFDGSALIGKTDSRLSEIPKEKLARLSDSLAKKNISPSAYKNAVEALEKEYGVELERKDTYAYELELLKAGNDLSPTAQERFIGEWKELNKSAYKGSDNAAFLKNAKEIAEYEAQLLDESFGKGLISAEEYANALTEIFARAKADGADLGEELASQWSEKARESIVKNEKSLITERKKEAEEYYNAQIDALREIRNESERTARAEKLRLELAKALAELDDSVSQRNVLIYENGAFRYDSDPERISSAAEKLSSVKAQLNSLRSEESISKLKTQQKETAARYDELLKGIDGSGGGLMGTALTEKALVEALGGRWTEKSMSALSSAGIALSAENAASRQTGSAAVKPVSVGTINISNDFHVESIEGMVDEKIDELCARLSGKLRERLPRALAGQ